MGEGLRKKKKGKSNRKGGLEPGHALTHAHLSRHTKYNTKKCKKHAYTSEHPGPRPPHHNGSNPEGTVTKATLQDPTTHMQNDTHARNKKNI